MDVVFCRNVMIYFSDDVKKQIVRGFYNALQPGGYFYIGHSETLHGISKAFKLVYFKNALVYQKEAVRRPQPNGSRRRHHMSGNTSSAAVGRGARHGPAEQDQADDGEEMKRERGHVV